ncbi:SAM-dependent methyltransferase [bacterium DOLJORAL78_65_58]|nr:MAG: SAM-dependent methyltransferase [bacterium DOLZORAL124_64_63]PIE76791.1 MAG: SAM-dependent methyltransferase [bacterium DOLJORAL78_65_58]
MTRPWFETAFGAHYPRLYAHRDEAEARLCLDLLPRMAPLQPTGRPVLDLGCGDGRHLARIAEMTSLVLGLDLSRDLLRLAAGRPGTGNLVRGDMRRLPLRAGSLDSVLSLFTAFGYFGPLAGNAPVVREVARVLTTGGHWFLDYLDPERVRAELAGRPPVRRERLLGEARVLETRRLSADGTQVCKEVVLHHDPGAEPLRYTEEVALFSLEQMDDLAATCGLRRVAAAGSYGGAELGAGDRWILVYRRETP